MAADRVAVFTICAANYLAQASVLAESLAAQHPGRRLTAFLLDRPPAGVPVSPALDLVDAEGVVGPDSWRHKTCHYDVLELSTSIKPDCFLYVLRDHDAAFYFDPDIRLLAPLPALESWPDGAPSVILTPHLLSPLPDDGYYPGTIDILKSGSYNLGFAAFRGDAAARDFLGWWAGVLQDHCLADTKAGLFTDQKWVNFATTFLDHVWVDRDPGCNVAYWNLHEREPRRAGAGWVVRTADGAAHPLRFFHFSGFAPDRPTLSKHEDRYGIRPPGETRALMADYGAALLEAGHDTFAALPPAAVRFADGLGWDPVCRALYRWARDEQVPLGDVLAGPAFLAWAKGRDPGDHLPRYLRALFRLRPEVGQAFDDGRNRAGVLRWLQGSGVEELGLDPRLLDRLGLRQEAPAVHYVGYLRSHLGLAEAARNSIVALRGAGVAVQTHDISDQAGSPMGEYADAASDGQQAAPIAILAFNADQTPAVLPRLPDAVRDTYRIGVWYWETPEFPEAWCDRFDMVDEVWAGTEYVAQAIRAKATVPVAVLPPMVSPPAVTGDRAWLQSLIPGVAADEFLFLFQFDVASVPFRKNPEGTVEAFVRAFAPQDPSRLIVKLLNADRDPALMARLRALAGPARVSFFDQPLDSLDRFRLLASIDCFVSLHRAEGFGLSIAESMAYGLPVVTTGWSGNADFTCETNAAIVAYDLRLTEVAHGPYPAGTVWAEPRLDDAARQMRRVFADPAWRAEIGRAGAETIARQLSRDAVGAAMRARIDRIMASARILGGGAARAARPVAAPAMRVGRVSATVALMDDVRRYPGYYVSRLNRLPALLYRHGVRGIWHRAHAARVIASPAHKQKFKLGAALRSMLARLRLRGAGASSGRPAE